MLILWGVVIFTGEVPTIDIIYKTVTVIIDPIIGYFVIIVPDD